MAAEGEVEKKVTELCESIFEQYNPGKANVDGDNKPFITKENLREFIKTIMEDAREQEAWDDQDFEDGYNQFDKDRSGQIDEQEFKDFVKRFADLWFVQLSHVKARDEQLTLIKCHLSNFKSFTKHMLIS